MKFVICFVATLIVAGSLHAQNNVLKVGQQAPDISLPTPAGDTVSLSSLKGKLVLVDFWATWCAPCVKEQPELKALYGKHQGGTADSRFEIVGVSLDKSKENWVKAIERFRIDWIQVSDLMFWKSPVAKTYAIEELPFNVLVDEHGNIVAINLHGEDLEKAVATYLE